MIFKWLYDVFNNDCIVLAIIVVIVLSFLWVSRHGKPVKLSDNGGYEESGNDYAVCASPECIRCQRYDVIRIAAPHRLRVIADQSNWEGLERIQKAFQVEPPELLSQFQQPNVFYMPDIAAVPWWPSVQFTEVNKILQNNFGTILSEFLNVFEALKTWDPSAFDDNNLDPVQMGWLINDTPSGCWCVFHLYNQGVKIEPSCAICPRTAELLETLPGFMHSCVFGNASFSVVYPQTVIAEHFGPCNVRIRCHLGLQTPNHCSLTVKEESRAWETGRCLFFDDSFLHSVENLSDPSCPPRVVFMTDLWHPDLSEQERNALTTVFSSAPIDIANMETN